MIQEELVNVAVPRSRLAEVYALLGARPDAAAPVGAGEPPAEVDGWTDELLARAYRESAERMRRLFDHLVAQAGTWVSAEQLASALKVSQPQIRGVLGGFGHRMRSRYKQASWPVDYRYDPGLATSFYRMGTARADAFKRAKSRA
jgi:hypothetical protein